MGTKRKDRTGQRYGRLVIRRFAYTGKRYKTFWVCACDCGNTVVVDYEHLRVGHTQSCGCLQRDRTRETCLIHGLSTNGKGKTARLYDIWQNMWSRCTKPTNIYYKHYGGRGIAVCKEWEDVSVFFAWALANGYASHLTIDRINNDGDYSPTNCRWASPKQQARNMRTNHWITFKGQTKCLSEWADIVKINSSTLHSRLSRGWSPEAAMTVPVEQQQHP